MAFGFLSGDVYEGGDWIGSGTGWRGKIIGLTGGLPFVKLHQKEGRVVPGCRAWQRADRNATQNNDLQFVC